MINPFGFAAKDNLSLQEYEQIAMALVNDYCIILPTFDQYTPLVKENLSPSLLNHQNFIIFDNNSDLLNLVELISKINLLISPSTGNIHIADNLSIPSIGLFSYRDTIAWGGENINYIILDQLPRKEALEQTIQQTHSLLNP